MMGCEWTAYGVPRGDPSFENDRNVSVFRPNIIRMPSQNVINRIETFYFSNKRATQAFCHSLFVYSTTVVRRSVLSLFVRCYCSKVYDCERSAWAKHDKLFLVPNIINQDCFRLDMAAFHRFNISHQFAMMYFGCLRNACMKEKDRAGEREQDKIEDKEASGAQPIDIIL